MNRGYVIRFLLVAAIVALYCVCSGVGPVSGGSSQQGNGVVVGRVVDDAGKAVASVRVSLLPSDYNPVEDASTGVFSGITNDEGTYTISGIIDGNYTIEATEAQTGRKALISGIAVTSEENTVVEQAVLRTTGSIRIELPEAYNAVKGYVYLPGTTLAGQVRDGVAVIDSVPAAEIPSVNFVPAADSDDVIIRNNLLVIPGDTVVVYNPVWRYARRIVLNTTASGADVSGDVYGFPVLVRFLEDAFDFAQAKTGGEDIRFTSSNGTPFPYEIEQWDAAGRRAAIWVRVDTVNGNDSTQSIIMYWGNQVATDASSSAAVFDTAAGFQGVWHLGDTSGDSVRDATTNRYHGISPDTARPSIAEGVAGNCRVFDGVTDFITMPNTADSRLNFPEGGYYTLCAWVSLDTFDNEPHLIVAKGFTQYHLRFTYFPSNSPVWEFVEFSESSRWKACTTSATSRQWTLLTGVREGSRQLLYCNGVLVDSTPNSYPNNNFSRDMSNDLSIGKFLPAVDVQGVVDSSDGFFKGSIDEVRILNAAQSPDWVRLCYMNQRAEDRLVVFK